MQHHATLVQAGQPPLAGKATSSGLPRDLLEQVRGRLGLLALLMLFAFAIDPFFYFGTWAVVTLGGGTVAADYFRNAAYYWSDLAVVAADHLPVPEPHVERQERAYEDQGHGGLSQSLADRPRLGFHARAGYAAAVP